MVELPNVHGFPTFEAVTLLAVWTEPPFVLVLVAGRTSFWNAQETPAQVSDLDGRSFRSRDLVGGVATIACEPGMLPFQRVAGLLMIENFGLPFDYREVGPIVLGMTAGTILTRSGFDAVLSV